MSPMSECVLAMAKEKQGRAAQRHQPGKPTPFSPGVIKMNKYAGAANCPRNEPGVIWKFRCVAGRPACSRSSAIEPAPDSCRSHIDCARPLVGKKPDNHCT